MLNQRIWREDIYEKYGESATNDHQKLKKSFIQGLFFMSEGEIATILLPLDEKSYLF